jgi:hypothetical protein
MSRAEVERKFLSNAGKRLPGGQARAVLRNLWELERAGDLAALLAKLRIPA